ncbi:DUF2905 family protein [Rudanella paleaurantiibacter]|uniref:DUF2905 family protein n=1 Tax=Rudanella paleaurantiibacter TaxID=2614655 RepID=A0A7J5U262_9BACT|nr:DUF2905 domain-containing protein [Rudanella paleaurantiibacter]KAB7731044.1 DUF2905 family protein [Rudanella paleaurantiibacter]
MNTWLGKYLIIIGAALLVVGAVVYFVGDRWPTWLIPGRLPGDIRIEGKNGGGFYFPVVTCIVASILLNLLISLIRRLF